MKRLGFYLQYAARNLWRNRRWSNFAIFSVAAGVATVVALRSLGLGIGDALTSNVRGTNHGDISLNIGSVGFFNFDEPDENNGFSPGDIQIVADWVEQNNARMSVSTASGGIQITALDFNVAGRPQLITSYFIDPTTYPPTDDIRAIEPAGVRLGDLFHGGNEVVVSENLAQTQDIQVGDIVRVSGTTDEFVVRGIVPTNAEAGLRNIFAAFFGFAYFDQSLKTTLPVQESPNRIAIALQDGATAPEIKRAVDDLLRPFGNYRRFSTVTTTQIIQQNQQVADFLGSFIVVLGLGALLIGGVGIMNTMLVMVRRRTEEIAALKTFGLKGRQIAALFMSEALLLGLMGSIVGSLFGVVLSGLANAYGQTLIQQPISWRIYPEAILFGFALGMVITAVFGVAPVLTAVKIRPAIILRPNETYIPRAGCLQSLAVLVLVVLVIGAIAGQIMNPTFQIWRGEPPNSLVIGIIGVAGTLLILGLLIGLLWIVVWIIGRLPAFGWPELRLALRNLSTHRLRTATTLLALCAGMFALSSISFFGAGARQIVQFSLSQTFGGNVLIFPVLPANISNRVVDAKLASLPGVTSRTRILVYDASIRAIDEYNLDNPASLPSGDIILGEETVRPQNLSDRFDLRNLDLVIRDTNNPNLTSGALLAGRDLTPDDRGQQVMVIRSNPLLQALGLRVGSSISIRVDGQSFTFEVVGILPDNQNDLQSGFLFGGIIVPPDTLPGVEAPQFQPTVAQVEPEQLNNVLLGLSEMPLVFSIDITFIDSFLGRLIEQMSAIPILVGLLSLGAAAVIMANTVALATLERRRQIGILKAVGLKGGRVLRVMLLENTVISLLGGLLGIGLSAIGVALVAHFSASLSIVVPTDSTPVVILLLGAAILIAWTATVLSARAVMHERVTNVLRYE
jgi:putative ABC transport system permease protein